MVKQYTIYSYTIMRSATLDFKDKVPYLVGILADENNGLRQTEFINGYQEGREIKIGDKVIETTDADGAKVFSLAGRA